MKKFLFASLALLILASCGNGTKALKSSNVNRAEKIVAEIHNPNSKNVLVISHRGDWRNYPENSIPAIESVIRMGVDVMELDLKLTKDGVLVLCHDKTIDRTTTGKGLVSDITYKDLMKLKLRRAHNVATDTLRMPTLREALICCKDRIVVNVDQGYEFYDMVVEIAEEVGVVDQILIKGNKPMKEVDAKMAAHSHNLMYMPIVNIHSEAGQKLFNSYIESGKAPLAYEICWKDWNAPEFKDCVHKILTTGSKLWVNTFWPSVCGGFGNDDDAAYNAKDPADVYERYINLGATMIQTDRPEYLLNYLRKKGLHD